LNRLHPEEEHRVDRRFVIAIVDAAAGELERQLGRIAQVLADMLSHA
jgi:hypothetical protein